MSAEQSITIRRATGADADAVDRLAQLESVPSPVGDLLVAEVDGEIWAAAELTPGAVIADPFRPSGAVAELLRLRVKRLQGAGRRSGPRGLLQGRPPILRRARWSDRSLDSRDQTPSRDADGRGAACA
jgi:hypothetical protein